jgi:AcrR family transcriptional regulator
MPRPAVKKGRIIESAISLFATKGLARTSIRDIASIAEVTEGALYRHWDGKETMAWELYCETLEAFGDGFREWLDWPGIRGDSPAQPIPFERRLRDGVTYAYEYYRDHPRRFAFILLTQHGFLEKEYEPESPYEIVEKIIASEFGIPLVGGTAPEEAKVVAAMVLGAVLEPIKYHWRGWSIADPLDRVETVVTGILGLLDALRPGTT